MNKKYAIGVDIGGSHISTVLVDIEKHKVIDESLAKQEVDNQASAKDILKSWSEAISRTMSHIEVNDLAGIGFAMPGPFNYETGVSLMKNVAKYDCLYGINVGEELKKLLNLPPTMPFRYLNDALSFAVGECWQGEPSAFKNVVAITLGTGFGSAFVSEGVPVIEGNRVPKMGYVYHIPYESGIADDYFSTRWFTREYFKRTGIQASGVKEIVDRKDEDAEVRTLFKDFGTNLGNFMAPLLLDFEANCLVIGGNISGAFYLFGPTLMWALKSHKTGVEIVISEMMEMAAMSGSARLLDDSFWQKIQPLVSKI